MATVSPDRSSAKYDAFISYSHGADAALAPALQRALHALARPWYRLRALRVFRDETSLAANPALWPSIERALASSRWLIYLASPQAAQSIWVQKELDWWIAHRGTASLLIVVTGGRLNWNHAAGDFDWAVTDSLPRSLSGTFQNEPLWVDLAWTTNAETRSLRHTRFRAAALRIASATRGQDPDDLDGEDLKVFRRNRLIARIGVAVLLALTGVSIAAAALAVVRTRESVSRELAMASVQQLETDPELSLRLAMHAADSAETPQAEEALRRALLESRIIQGRNVPAQGHHVGYAADGRTVYIAAGQTVQVFRQGMTEPRILQHPTVAWAIDLSRDATRLAVGGWDGKVRIWDVVSGALVVECAAGTTPTTEGSFTLVNAVAFSPDGSRLVAFTDDQIRDQKGLATVWDTRTGQRTATLRGHSRTITQAVFSPDGRDIATSSHDATVKVWDAESGSLRRTLSGHTDVVQAVAYVDEGRTIVSASLDTTVRVWDTATGTARAVMGTPAQRRPGFVGAPAVDVALSGSGTRAVVATQSRAVVYATDSRSELSRLEDYPPSCPRAFFSHDARLVACGSREGVATVWRVENGTPVATLRGHRGEINHLAISPDNQVLMTAGTDNTVREWTLAPLAPELVFDHGDVATWSADGRHVATGSSDIVRVWDARSGEQLAEARIPMPPYGRAPGVRALSFSRDSRHLLVHANGFGAGVWRVGDRAPIEPLEPVSSLVQQLSDAFWGPGDRVIAGIAEESHPNSADPDGDWTRGSPLVRWTAETRRILGRTLFEPRSKDEYQATCGYHRASGLLCLWNGENGPAQIVDVMTGEKKATLGPLDENIWLGAFSPDASLFALSDQERIEVWRPRTGERAFTIARSADLFITDLAFDPEGRRLIASGGQMTPIARIWDVAQGRPLIDLRGHTHSLTTAKFSPDGQLVVTASQDGTARVWRVADGQPITVYRGHRGMVADVQFSVDGRRVLSSGADNTARIFEASLAPSLSELLIVAHQRRTRNLTPKERDQFIH